MKYRKKPVEIEAIQFIIRDFKNIHKTINFFGRSYEIKGELYDRYVEILTLEGTMRADHGDYIIKGINGEVYPCKPDIFLKTYEKV
ncbi:hypothetical protein KYB31_09190 [Clostridium felsineum]|uniref:hypothetical protein n=1 Tax=Clostridium felsineum TaxID=36839 RepID=UPI00214DEFA3|nr:hypothetical protein [Clostridium felsineum]MCR3759163.1 hypothetical protein [Clostridium felsineum]